MHMCDLDCEAEADTGCVPQWLPILLFQIGSLTHLEPKDSEKLASPARPRHPLVSQYCGTDQHMNTCLAFHTGAI